MSEDGNAMTSSKACKRSSTASLARCNCAARPWSIPSAPSRLGWATRFKVKTLKHVATEMALHVLAYNIKRVSRDRWCDGLLKAIATFLLQIMGSKAALTTPESAC